MGKLLVNISKRIGVLGRIRNNLTVDAANKVYQSLVLPVMDYCDVAWSSIGKIERDKLDRAQRRAARIVLKTKDSDAEKNLKWLPLSMRRDMHTINLTFKCLKGSPPMFFKDYFKVFRTIHNTRSSRTCCSPKSELRRQGTLFILMDRNFLIIFHVQLAASKLTEGQISAFLTDFVKLSRR